MLYSKCERYLKKIVFSDHIELSELKVHSQPEKSPYYNSKCFELYLNSISLKNIESMTSMYNSKTMEKIKFNVFAFDDDFIINLHMFFKNYKDFVGKRKKREEFLKAKISMFKVDDEILNIETLNYKKHLENYKVKMKLLISKMKKDREEIE